MATYASLRSKQNELLRKATDGSVFIGPQSVPLMTTLTTGASSELTTLPVGMKDAGWMTEDGVTFSRDITTSDTSSWGSTTPTRSDITGDTSTLSFTAQETNIVTLDLATGYDMSTVTPTASTGEVSLKKALVPAKRRYRVLALAVDSSPDGEIYIARYFPAAEVNSFSDETFAGGDAGIEYTVTMTGFFDSTFGAAEARFFAGPGWKAQLVKAGFPAAT